MSPASERPPLLHALHVLTTQLLVVDLLSPTAVLPGNRFCASLIEALAAKLPHCPVNAYSWPEMLRMVLLARAVGQARKKRAVAMHAMISAGIGSVVVATAAAAALGGGHAVSVWSAGTAADEVDADEDGGGGAQGGTNDWAHVCDALGGDVEYEDLDVPMRCQARPLVRMGLGPWGSGAGAQGLGLGFGSWGAGLGPALRLTVRRDAPGARVRRTAADGDGAGGPLLRDVAARCGEAQRPEALRVQGVHRSAM